MNDFKWIWAAGATVVIATGANIIEIYAKQAAIEAHMADVDRSLQTAHDTNGKQWERLQWLRDEMR